MGYCWYCHWGWAKPVVEIYEKAVNDLDGDDSPLEFGPSHIVWSDENFEDHNIDFCLALKDEEYADRYSPSALAVVRRSLEELRALPESVRCCRPAEFPEDDNEARPGDYPPTVETAFPFAPPKEAKE